MNLSSPGRDILITTHRGWGIWSLASISCYVALIPRGLINHGGDKPWYIQSERYPIRGGGPEKQRLAQALLCIWRYSRTICVISGMQECCLLNHVYIHSFRSIIEAAEKFPGGGGIWTAFRPREEGIWTKIFQKFKCPGGCPRGMFKLRFDWYIMMEILLILYTSPYHI